MTLKKNRVEEKNYYKENKDRLLEKINCTKKHLYPTPPKNINKIMYLKKNNY